MQTEDIAHEMYRREEDYHAVRDYRMKLDEITQQAHRYLLPGLVITWAHGSIFANELKAVPVDVQGYNRAEDLEQRLAVIRGLVNQK